MQRALQTIRELLYNQDEEKKKQMLKDFSLYNKTGVVAAVHIFGEGFVTKENVQGIEIAELFDKLMTIIED